MLAVYFCPRDCTWSILLRYFCTARSTRSRRVTAKTSGSNHRTVLQGTASTGGARPHCCECRQYLFAGSNLNILEVQTASAAQNPEYCEISRYEQYRTLTYCRCSQYLKRFLRERKTSASPARNCTDSRRR